MPLEKTQRTIKEKKKKEEWRGASRGRARSAFTPSYLSMQHQTVPRELSTSFFPISSRIILASERKGLNDSRTISGDSGTWILFILHETAGSTELARPWKDREEEKTSQRHPWTATWLQPGS